MDPTKLKTVGGLLLVSLVCGGCGSAASTTDDLSEGDLAQAAPDLTVAIDMAAAIDLATEADLASAAADLASVPPDMTFVQRPPSMVWLSSGGGSFTGPVSSHKANLSLGGGCVFGRTVATGGASLSLGNLALNTD